jgi:hypothetical protein
MPENILKIREKCEACLNPRSPATILTERDSISMGKERAIRWLSSHLCGVKP